MSVMFVEVSMFVEPKTIVIQDPSEGIVSVMKDKNEMMEDIASAPYEDHLYSAFPSIAGACIEMEENEAVLLEPKPEHINNASLENISVANEVAEDKSHACHAVKQYPGKKLYGYVPRQWRCVKQYPGKKRIPEPCEKVELSSLRNTVMDSSRITEGTKTPTIQDVQLFSHRLKEADTFFHISNKPDAPDTSEDLPAIPRRRPDSAAVSDSSPGSDNTDIAEKNATRTCPRRQRKHAQNKTTRLGCANNTFSIRGLEENWHVCPECRTTFRYSRALCKHVRLQHCANRAFQCDLCSAAFQYPSFLKIHMRKHTGERPYLCEVCSAAFSEKGQLTTHMRTHTGERPYLCEVCSASFGKMNSLTSHMRTHTGERPYRCEVCSATFNQSSALLSHRRRHTGERPYRCIACSASFIQSCALTRHMRKHTGERPYRCEVCSALFGNRGALTKHMLMHTGDV